MNKKLPLFLFLLILFINSYSQDTAKENTFNALKQELTVKKILSDTVFRCETRGEGDYFPAYRIISSLTDSVIQMEKTRQAWAECKCRATYDVLWQEKVENKKHTLNTGAEIKNILKYNPPENEIMRSYRPAKAEMTFYDSGYMTFTLRKNANNYIRMYYKLSRFGDAGNQPLVFPNGILPGNKNRTNQYDSIAKEISNLETLMLKLPRTSIDSSATYRFRYANIYSSSYTFDRDFGNGTYCRIYTGEESDTLTGKALMGFAQNIKDPFMLNSGGANGHGEKYVKVHSHYSEHRAMADIDKDGYYYFEKIENTSKTKK